MLNSTEHEIYHETDDIMTLMNMINTASENLKARKFFTFQHSSLYEQLEFRRLS